MSISDRSRKFLWGKSGNRCAISKIELICDPTGETDESIIGEECHICARSPGGPRYNPNLSELEIDECNNLILLSRNYHKIIDENSNYYTAERLLKIKHTHEDWVSKTLSYKIFLNSVNSPESRISFLARIMTGNQLFNAIYGCDGYEFDHDELHNEAEVDLVGAFLQNAQDWGELVADLDAGERVRVKNVLFNELQRLEENGFWGCDFKEGKIGS